MTSHLYPLIRFTGDRSTYKQRTFMYRIVLPRLVRRTSSSCTGSFNLMLEKDLTYLLFRILIRDLIGQI
jgi:hypothetical protein